MIDWNIDAMADAIADRIGPALSRLEADRDALREALREVRDLLDSPDGAGVLAALDVVDAALTASETPDTVKDDQ